VQFIIKYTIKAEKGTYVQLYSFFNIDANWGGWLTQCPGCSTPVPFVQEVGWAPTPVWAGAENIAPYGFEPQTVQPAASPYTNYAIPAHKHTHTNNLHWLNTHMYYWSDYYFIASASLTISAVQVITRRRFSFLCNLTFIEFVSMHTTKASLSDGPRPCYWRVWIIDWL
jgi:hypothetical protein